MPMDIDTSRRNKRPRPLSDEERARLEEFIDSIHYSSRYVKREASVLERSRLLTAGQIFR